MQVQSSNAPSKHKRYFYRLLAHHLSFYLPASTRVAEIHPHTPLLRQALAGQPVKIVEPTQPAAFEPSEVISFDALRGEAPDRVVLNGCIHFVPDVQDLLEKVHAICAAHTRVLLTYYSTVWKPILTLASRLGLADTGREHNWLAPSDIGHLLRLSGFELVVEFQAVFSTGLRSAAECLREPVAGAASGLPAVCIGQYRRRPEKGRRRR